MQDEPTVLGGEYADIGSRLSKAFSLYIGYFLPFFLISLITVPLALVAAIWEWGFVFSIPNLVVSGIANAAMVLCTRQALANTTPQPGPNLSAAIDKLGRLIEYGLRTFGAVIGLAITIIGIPWAIRVGVRWFFGTQGIMLQDLDAKGAISESCRLVEGDWWRSFGNLLLVGLIVAIPNVIFLIVFPPGVGGVIGVAIGTLTGPFVTIAYTLYYLRLRQEKGAASELPGTLAPEPA